MVSNGFKKEVYIKKIAELINVGFKNVYTILDNKNELDHLVKEMKSISEGEFDKLKVGIRIATEEDPKFDFYTSRLGIGYKDIVPFYKRQIQNNDHVELRMLHFFVNTGISDSAYYWNELLKCVNVYCDLKEICPELDSLNIGGGFPIKNSLNFSKFIYKSKASNFFAG